MAIQDSQERTHSLLANGFTGAIELCLFFLNVKLGKVIILTINDYLGIKIVVFFFVLAEGSLS